MTASNPGDVDDWLIACASKAGFRKHQWDAMFFERQPYDVTYATIELKNFAQQILAGENADETPAVPGLPWLPIADGLVEGEALLWQTHNGQGWAVHQPPQAHYWKPGMTHYLPIRGPDKT